MVSTKELTGMLIQRYSTRNPFDLAISLGIIILYEPPGEIQGFYNRCFRQKFIHMNQELEGELASFTCAHELGHAILHPQTDTPFLRAHTRFSVGRLEHEANCFALDLIYDDYELAPFLARSITDAAAFMGVPFSLAEYRLSSSPPMQLAGADTNERSRYQIYILKGAH